MFVATKVYSDTVNCACVLLVKQSKFMNVFAVLSPIPRWPGMFKAIGTGGREFEPRPGLAVPQKLLHVLEWPISA